MFSPLNTTSADRYIAEKLDKSPVSPVMRFRIADKTKRLFVAERMTYRGDGGWRWLGSTMKLAALVDKYLPHLGKDSFFELF